MLTLREYQIKGSADVVILLQKHKIAYLCWEVRLGKTLTALNAANNYGAKKVLFITKKLAIKSIQSDYEALQPTFNITIINNESLHKVMDNDFDLLISDEHHRLSAFPKPNRTTKDIKKRFSFLPMIFLSGTPAIESGSQWYHSFFVSYYTPFRHYANFYKFAKDFVNVKTKFLGAIKANDYSDAKMELLDPIIAPYLVKFTQEEAGFKSAITEQVLYCEMKTTTKVIVDRLLKERILQGSKEVILADTPAKLLSKIHQISNGTCIFESGNSVIIDDSKAVFIRDKFKGKKIAIFYFFQKEYELLKQVFGELLTSDLNEFNTTDKCIALQQVRGSEGISLKQAEALVYYSFGYAGRQYVQGIARMQTIDREVNSVYFVFAKGDINEKIYNVISKKKRYNEKLFIKDYGN
jgi:hypothetical protein